MKKNYKEKEKIKLKGTAVITKKRNGQVVSVHRYTNVFCDNGKYSILERMAGDDKGQITYLALGNDTTTPVKTDTKLGNETFRKAVTNRTRSGLIFLASTFLASTEANSTYKEMGLYGDDATVAADSGMLYTHLTIDETKTSAETITIDYSLQVLL